MYLEDIAGKIHSSKQLQKVIETVSPAHGEMLRQLAQHSNHWQNVLYIMEHVSDGINPVRYARLALFDFCYVVREYGTEAEFQDLLEKINIAVGE